LKKYMREIGVAVMGVLAAVSLVAAEGEQPAPPASHQEAQEFMKKVIVTVNKVPITVGEVDKAVSSYIPQAVFHQSVSEDKLITYRQQALQSLISRELMYQEAQKRGLEIGDDIVDKHIADLKAKYGGEAKFKEVLEKNHYTLESYREITRRETLIDLMNEKGGGEPPVVTDEDVKKYYEANIDRFVEPEKVKVSHILIKVNPSSSRKEFEGLLKKSEMILAKAKEKGADFAALATEFSDDPSSEQGGDVGFVHRGRLEPEFEEAAFSMQIGEIRGLVRTLYGFHIMKLEAKIPPRQVELEEIKDKLKKDLQRDSENKARRDWLKGLWEKAEIVYIPVVEK